MKRPFSHLLPALAAVSLTGACGPLWEPAFDEPVSETRLASITVAPLDDALTFVRTRSDGRTLVVRRYEDGQVEGLDVTSDAHVDAIELFADLGYDTVVDRVRSADESAWEHVPVAALGLPVGLTDHHVAAGTNYPEHANEVGTEGQPYLFPKLVQPTAWDAPVSVRGGLLDYEVELAYVMLEDEDPTSPPEYLGLILANDFTDRATLLRNLDPGDVESGQGFTTGKSFPGYLPVGNLFVIPRDYRSFADGTELQLAVNGDLRQRAFHEVAVWRIDTLFEEITRQEGTTWTHGDAEVALPLGEGRLPARTMILTGTPHGVVFNEVGTEQRFTGFVTWLFAGWGRSIPDHAIEDYILDARAAGIYLLEGDTVDAFAQGMGAIRSEVVQ